MFKCLLLLDTTDNEPIWLEFRKYNNLIDEDLMKTSLA